MIIIQKGSVEQDDGSYLYYHYDTELRKVVEITNKEPEK